MLGSYLSLTLFGDNPGLVLEVDSVLGLYLRLTLIEDNAGLLLEIGFMLWTILVVGSY